MSVEVTFNPDEFIRRVKQARDDGCFAAAKVGADAAQALVSSGTRWQSSAPGSPPAFQTGKLAGAIHFVHPDQLGTPGHAAFGTNVMHGKYMEFGAHPVAKGKALPVPVNVKAKQMLQRLAGQSLRTEKMRLQKRPGKAPLLVEQTASGKKDKKDGAVFVLVKSVRIAARPWLRPASQQAGAAMAVAFREKFAEVSGIKP
jgi:hypothetical protein